MKKYLLYLVTLSAGFTLASDPEHRCEDEYREWVQIWRTSSVTWKPLQMNRSYEELCNDDSEYRLSYATRRATLESKVGNHPAALAFFDWRTHRYYTDDDLPQSVRAESAIDYIVDRSADQPFVIVNERHHVSSDRLLTLALLEPLSDLGFRYLAVEGYRFDDGINERGYPLIGGGYYSNDVVYAQMLRSASELGFQVVGYEIEDDQRAPDDPENPVDRQVERDRVQAENIIDRILKKDPDAKVTCSLRIRTRA